MKKTIIAILFMAIGTTTFGQYAWDKVEAKKELKLKGKTVNCISTDSSGNSKSASSLITERAAKIYADAKTASIAGLPSQTGNSATYLTTNGSVANWALVNLATGVTGNLPVNNLGSGSNALSTTVFHGNGVWNPVSLSTDVANNLPVTRLNSGTLASGTTFWCGDGTWKTAGGTTINSSALPGSGSYSLPGGGGQAYGLYKGNKVMHDSASNTYKAIASNAYSYVEIYANNATIGSAQNGFEQYFIGGSFSITNVNISNCLDGGTSALQVGRKITISNNSAVSVTLTFTAGALLTPAVFNSDSGTGSNIATYTLPAGYTINLIMVSMGSGISRAWTACGTYPNR